MAISDYNADAQDFTIFERSPNREGLTCECGSALLPDERHADWFVRTARKSIIQVRVCTLDALQLGHIDLLTVDVEGGELAVMRGLTDNPNVVVLENYPLNRQNPEYEVYMRSRGYRLDGNAGHNQIYVQEFSSCTKAVKA